MVSLIAVALLAYALGSIPTALWLGKAMHGIDIREYGSGNPGATNAARILGRHAGVFVLVSDVAKGFLAVWLVSRLRLGPVPWSALEVRLLAACCAVAGHIWSVFALFRGGKGVATAGGAFLAVHPLATGLAMAVFGGIVGATRIVSLGSMIGSLSLPLILWMLRAVAGFDIGVPSILASAVVAAMIVFAHRSNLRRLLSGAEEPGL